MGASREDDGPDAGIAAFLASVRSEPQSARQTGVEAMRAAQRRRVALRGPGPQVHAVEDFVVTGTHPTSVRLYRPTADSSPLVVYLHGGGWSIGGLDSHDATCRSLAVRAGVAVLAVDYRLAPEHPWPGAIEDSYEVVRWTCGASEQLGSGGRVALAGDSSGANLATLVCLRMRDEGLPALVGQVLAYPNTDLTLSQPSMREKSTGWGLTASDVEWFVEQWIGGATPASDPRVSPLSEPDLRGLPPAIVVTAEHDVLRDEGDAYARALAAAGVSVTHRCEPGLVHGFLGLTESSPAAAAAAGRLFEDVRRLLRP